MIGRIRRARLSAAWNAIAALAALAISGAVGRAEYQESGSGRPALAVEVSGCAAMTEGPICELPEDGALRLWVPGGEGAEIRVDGAAVQAEETAVQGGVLHKVKVGARARELWARGDGGRSFRMALREGPRMPEAIGRAEALRKEGKLDEAEAALGGVVEDRDPVVRARAIGLLGRIDLRLDRYDAGMEKLRDAMRLDRQTGRPGEVFRDGFALAFALIQKDKLAEARRVLDELVVTPLQAEYRLRKRYYEGLLTYRAADYRAALSALHAASEGAERLELTTYRLGALSMEGVVLGTLGRVVEGEAQLAEADRVAAGGSSPCDRASLFTNWGWLALHAQRPPDVERGARRIDRALELYRGKCPDQEGAGNALTELTLAALDRGRPGEASKLLADARKELPHPGSHIAVWWDDVEGRVALADGRPAAALGAYERLSRRGLSPEDRWRAALGEARALAALDRVAEARAAFAEAESSLKEAALLVPFDRSQASFLEMFEESGRLRVDFLLGVDPVEAAGAARSARARAIAALSLIDRLGSAAPAERKAWDEAVFAYRAERDALDASSANWTLSQEAHSAEIAGHKARVKELADRLDRARVALESARPAAGTLAPPEPGEIVLVYYPIRRGWAGFALTSRGAVARDLGEIDFAGSRERLADTLLGPFREAIDTAQRIRVIAYGEVDRLDLHDLPWEGANLVTKVPVVYGVDRPLARSPSPGAAGALVISDPRGDLPAARREGEGVAAALRKASGAPVDRLAGEAATHRAVLAALGGGRVSVLHYAGHGRFDPRGEEAALPLADGGWLTTSDILTLAAAPERVVLSGCETARTGAARVEGIGLAQAFVAAGSRVVVAATRPVDDAVAAAFMEAFYDAKAASADPEIDAAERLRAASIAVAGRLPGADWASFRVIVP